MMTERRIKDLSLALESLSRTNSYLVVELRDKIERLLASEIDVAERQQHERAQMEKVSLRMPDLTADEMHHEMSR